LLLPRCTEQLERLAVTIFQLNLLTAWSRLHFIAEMQSRALQGLDPGRKVRHLENHTIPAARFLRVAIRHRARTRRARATENQFEIAGRNLGKSRQMLLIQLETELLSV